MHSKLVLISVLVCLAAAASVNGARINQAQARKLKARQVELDEDLDSVAETYAINDDGEVLVDSEGHSAALQLAPSHPDYKGPYHYEKPTVAVKTSDPTVIVEYLPPTIIVDPLPPTVIVDEDYLPPHAAGPRDDSLVKRSVKLHVLRSSRRN